MQRKFHFFRGVLTVTMTILIQLSILTLNMSFKSLVSAVTEQCQEIKQALALLPYFENWESDLVAECCRVSSIAEFPPENVILGPDVGNSHMVYFVLEGVCKIIQNLYVEVKTDFRQKKLYNLCSFSKRKTLNEIFKSEPYYSRLFNHKQDFQAEEKFKVVTDCDETKSCDSKNEFPADEEKKRKEKLKIPRSQVQVSKNKSGIDNVLEEINSANQSRNGTEMNTTNLQKEEEKLQPIGEITYGPDHHRRILQECKKKCEETIRFCKKISVPEKPKNVETFFMQTGLLFRGACFGLDQSIKENFMSVTRVKCLKIPRRFLLHHNPCNIWNRIRLFYSLYFPKDDKIFECFRSDLKWIENKKKQTEEIVYLKNLFNYTLINDVPYFIRLTERR